MQLKTFAYAFAIAATAAVVAVGTASPSFAAKKKAKAAAAEDTGTWCMREQTPVCATRGGMKFTYASACFAQKDGAKVVSQGACGAKKKMSMKKAKKKKKM